LDQMQHTGIAPNKRNFELNDAVKWNEFQLK